MALIDDVKKILKELAPHGWEDLFQSHGLDITARDLQKELDRNSLSIDRNIQGFQDFAARGNKGIEPGLPSHSLLFHGLASPGVVSPIISKYPTLEMLDIIENYIYSRKNQSLEQLENAHGKENLVMATFAYQYKVSSKAAHQKYSDFSYSRTGISRVGTAPEVYDAKRRSFWISGKEDEINVMPARYGCFIAVRKRLSPNDSVLSGPTRGEFLIPVHKLFDGDECLKKGNKRLTIRLKFEENHIQEKLNKIHTASPAAGGIIPESKFDITKPPFLQTSSDINLVGVSRAGNSYLLVPPASQSLVRTATQMVNGKNEVVRFQKPEPLNLWGVSTSQQIFDGGARIAPEYVNIRHQVIENQNGFILDDLNQTPVRKNDLRDEGFKNMLNAKKYEAAHFLDDCCEGAFIIKDEKEINYPIKPAYSILAAPDFFPLIDQAMIEGFMTEIRGMFGLNSHSVPLSSGRHRINPKLQVSGTNFEKTERNVTAIVGQFVAGSEVGIKIMDDISTSYLTDAASDLFHPGWDVSLTRENNDVFISTFGLGSPFPEDAKLCAALSSYWPAAAPDAARSFSFGPTIKPMSDEELGRHPNHPRVRSGEEKSQPGWDGEYGPFIEQVNGKEYMNYVNIERSDYVSNALNNTMRIDLVAKLNTNQLVQRIVAHLECLNLAQNPNLELVSVEEIENWSNQRLAGLSGSGFRFLMAVVADDFEVDPQEPVRRRKEVRHTLEFNLDDSQILWRKVNNRTNLPPFKRVTRRA